MAMSSSAKEDWRNDLDSLTVDEPPTQAHVDSWSFGHLSEMADRLMARVLKGVKTARSSLCLSCERAGERLPAVGDYNVILDGQEQPCAIVRTSEVIRKPFRQVDEAIAFDEGEGDQSLPFWRQVRLKFFAEECRELGYEPQWDMHVVGERFTRVYP